MKVTNTGKAKTGQVEQHQGGSRTHARVGAVAPMQATFAEVAIDLEARQLIAELEDIGGQLTRYPTSVLLDRYRQLVRMALERIRNGMHLKREFKWRRTERSMFVTIERTEEALEEIDEALLRAADRTRLLSLMEEIKGCLISLLF